MFELTYTLQNHGWATATFGNGEVTYSVNASYLSDPLGDLARAARGLIHGLSEVTFAFIQEPGDHRFVVTRQANNVFIEVFRRAGTFSPETGFSESVLLATCSLREFVNTAINCLRHILDECGEQEYLRRWKGCAFPRQELEELLVLRREQLTSPPVA